MKNEPLFLHCAKCIDKVETSPAEELSYHAYVKGSDITIVCRGCDEDVVTLELKHALRASCGDCGEPPRKSKKGISVK